jgi:putative oxidoreductase
VFHRLIHTTDDWTLTLLRFALGVIFCAHGFQKVLGWFGGPGFSGTMAFFTQTMGMPTLFAVLAIMAEFLGGIGLILGLLGRVAGFAIAVEMLVAVFLVHLPNGFFMNWYGNQKGEGFEFHLMAIVIALTIAVRGAGAVSLDRAVDVSLSEGQPIHPMPYPAPSRG